MTCLKKISVLGCVGVVFEIVSNMSKVKVKGGYRAENALRAAPVEANINGATGAIKTGVTYIAHIGDIHIQDKRRPEYAAVFAELYRMLEANKAEGKLDLIVVAGDVFDRKTVASATNIRDVAGFLSSLADIAPVVLISGNHDTNCLVPGSLDLLTPLIEESTRLSRVTYFRSSGVYFAHGFGWAVVATDGPLPADEEVASLKASGLPTICLFHEDVDGSRLPNSLQLRGSRLRPDYFDQFTMSMGGHIHLRQRAGPRAAYCGSLVQQNIGEHHNGHGYLLWRYAPGEPPRASPHDVVNKLGGFLRLDLDGGCNIVTPEPYPERPIYWELVHESADEVGLSRVAETAALLAERFGVRPRAIRARQSVIEAATKEKAGASTSEIGKDEALSEEGPATAACSSLVTTSSQASDVQEHVKIIRALLSKEDEEVVELVVELHKEMFRPEVRYAGRSRVRLERLEFCNAYCYGGPSVVDFTKLGGNALSGAPAPNYSGKSSLIDILVFMLYDEMPRAAKKKNIVFVEARKMSAALRFSVDGRVGVISKWRAGALSSVRFVFDGEDRTQGDQQSTLDEIAKVVGRSQHAFTTAIALQGSGSALTKATPARRKEIMSDLLALGIFVEIEAVVKTLKAEATGELKSLKAIKQREFAAEESQLDDRCKEVSSLLAESEQQAEEALIRAREAQVKQAKLSTMERALKCSPAPKTTGTAWWPIGEVAQELALLEASACAFGAASDAAGAGAARGVSGDIKDTNTVELARQLMALGSESSSLASADRDRIPRWFRPKQSSGITTGKVKAMEQAKRKKLFESLDWRAVGDIVSLASSVLRYVSPEILRKCGTATVEPLSPETVRMLDIQAEGLLAREDAAVRIEGAAASIEGVAARNKDAVQKSEEELEKVRPRELEVLQRLQTLVSKEPSLAEIAAHIEAEIAALPAAEGRESRYLQSLLEVKHARDSSGAVVAKTKEAARQLMLSLEVSDYVYDLTQEVAKQTARVELRARLVSEAQARRQWLKSNGDGKAAEQERQYVAYQRAVEASKQSAIRAQKAEAESVQAAQRLQELVRQAADAQAARRQLDLDRERHTEVLKRVNWLEKRAQVLTKYGAVLHPGKRGSIAGVLLSRVRSDLQKAINELLLDTSSGLEVIIDDDFEMVYLPSTLTAERRRTNTESLVLPVSLASEYQQFALGLAIRIAFWRLAEVPLPDCLIMDESFVACDSEHLAQTGDYVELLARSPSSPALVFIVSHLEEIKLRISKRIDIEVTFLRSGVPQSRVVQEGNGPPEMLDDFEQRSPRKKAPAKAVVSSKTLELLGPPPTSTKKTVIDARTTSAARATLVTRTALTESTAAKTEKELRAAELLKSLPKVKRRIPAKVANSSSS